MSSPEPPPPERRPDADEVAPVTAPAVPGRTILGTFLIIFGLAVTAAALGVLLAQWLWGRAEGVDTAGLWLAVLTGLLWTGTGVAFWRRMWVIGSLGTIAALIAGAIATAMIRN